MVVIGGGLHCQHSSCCFACCTAALCRRHRLLELQPTLHVQLCVALKIDASLQVSVSASSCTTELVHTTAQQGCSTQEDAALHHAYGLVCLG